MNKKTLQYIDFKPNEEMLEIYLTLLRKDPKNAFRSKLTDNEKTQVKMTTLRGIDAYIKYKKHNYITTTIFSENDTFNMIYYIASRMGNLSIDSSMILSEHIVVYLLDRLKLGFKLSFPNGKLFMVNGVLHCKFRTPPTTEEILNDTDWKEIDNRW